jgi:hypothetical protein
MYFTLGLISYLYPFQGYRKLFMLVWPLPSLWKYLLINRLRLVSYMDCLNIHEVLHGVQVCNY